jgi:NitT/TauT family transport system substrate-binding protein
MGRRIFVVLIVGLSFLLPAAYASGKEEKRVRVAQHFGTNSAPFTLIREQKLLEKRVPGVKVEWKKLSSGTDTMEAILADDLDVSAMGIAPFLTGWAKGVPVKIVSGLVIGPVKLVTWREDIKSITDFKPADKIAVPSMGSAQAIMLRMAAAKRMGNPKALDPMMVGMPHPVATAALLTKKEIAGHFATPPYLNQEISAGMKVILDSVDAVGEPYSGQIVMASKAFHDQEPAVFKALSESLKEAIEWLNADPARAAEFLKKADNYKVSVEELTKMLKNENQYDFTPRGVMPFVKFMHSQGMIKTAPKATEELLWK